MKEGELSNWLKLSKKCLRRMRILRDPRERRHPFGAYVRHLEFQIQGGSMRTVVRHRDAVRCGSDEDLGSG